ncbi:MAG: branched-chain amino acid ABC transporter permease [Chloroflexi bacterium]|nr:branched-chain amino acid ABC transporter permease [Chloroflexota bacterium]
MPNLAQGEFAMLGGMITIFLLKTLHVPYPVSAAIAVALTAFVGIAMYQLVIAPMGRAPFFSMVMITVGVSLFIQNGALIIWGANPASLPVFSGESPVRFGEVAIMPQSLWVLLLMAVILVVLYLLSNHTLLGKAMTATATDPLAASLVGISIGGVNRWSYAISAAIGALAGLTLAPIVPMSYISGALLFFKGLTALILGGWGLAAGAVVGGFALGIIETFGASLLPAGYKDAIAFLVLIAILYFRPSGILGGSHEGELKLR